MGRHKTDNKQKILNLISRTPIGLSIDCVSTRLKINRATAAKHLAVLEASQLILERELGKAKLYYPKEKEGVAWWL